MEPINQNTVSINIVISIVVVTLMHMLTGVRLMCYIFSITAPELPFEDTKIVEIFYRIERQLDTFNYGL